MAVGDILQVTVGQRLYNDVVQNVLYYRTTTVPAAADEEEDLASAFIAGVLPEWEAAVTDELKFDCLQVQKVSPDPIRNSFDTFLSGIGDVVGSSLPGRNCALIQKSNPAVTGKGKKGRVYISGIDETEESEGRLRAAQRTLLNTLGTALIDDQNGPAAGVYEPVWVTRSSTAPFGITGFVLWTNFLVKPIMASQKRRVTPVNSFAS